MKKQYLLRVGFVLALLLGAVVMGLWVGPVYHLVDGCACGRSRRWFALAEGPSCISRHMWFIQVKREGNDSHQHSYWDAQVAAIYPTDWIR